jgi:hypothetical protein
MQKRHEQELEQIWVQCTEQMEAMEEQHKTQIQQMQEQLQQVKEEHKAQIQKIEEQHKAQTKAASGHSRDTNAMEQQEATVPGWLRDVLERQNDILSGISDSRSQAAAQMKNPVIKLSNANLTKCPELTNAVHSAKSPFAVQEWMLGLADWVESLWPIHGEQLWTKITAAVETTWKDMKTATHDVKHEVTQADADLNEAERFVVATIYPTIRSSVPTTLRARFQCVHRKGGIELFLTFVRNQLDAQSRLDIQRSIETVENPAVPEAAAMIDALAVWSAQRANIIAGGGSVNQSKSVHALLETLTKKAPPKMRFALDVYENTHTLEGPALSEDDIAELYNFIVNKATLHIPVQSATNEENKRPHHTAWSADTSTKGRGKGGKGGMCTFFMSARGCIKGKTCAFRHGFIQGSEQRCFNCGASEHKVADCTRPRVPEDKSGTQDSNKTVEKKWEAQGRKCEMNEDENTHFQGHH